MDRFESMRTFMAVAEAGSFSGAARRLLLSKSLVTKRVAQLEAHLKVRLLNRTTRKVALSEIGGAYYEHCLRIVNDVEEIELSVSRAQREPRGRLRVCSPTSFGVAQLGPLLCGLRADYPALDLEVILNDRLINPLEEGYDLVVRDVPAAKGTLGEERIAPNRRLVCASPDYLARRGTPSHPADLAEHDCIHYSYLPSGRQWRFREPDGQDLIVNVPPGLSSNNGSIMCNAAVHGRGIAILPTFLIEPWLRNGALRSILQDYELPPYWISVVYPTARRLSAKVALVIERMKERFAPEPPWDCALPPA